MTLTTEDTHLGKNVSAPVHYDSSVLVRVPRAANRDQHGISGEGMYGYDLWRGYECSVLTENGVPFYFMIRIEYPSDSKYIVESKSLKLYLNSFNMTQLGLSPIREMCDMVRSDLTNLLECIVKVEQHNEYIHSTTYDMLSLSDLLDMNQIGCCEYNESPKLLKTSPVLAYRNFSWRFSGFRSNCKVTHAPDYAEVYINYAGEYGVDPESLFKYLVSFRNESHFHEECCELIFSRMMKVYNPSYLTVWCNYTRRGGIDINPVRTNSSDIGYRPHAMPRTIYQ